MLSSTIIAPSIFASSLSISGEYIQFFKAIPPLEIFSNLFEFPMTMRAPVFLSAIKSTPFLRGSPGSK